MGFGRKSSQWPGPVCPQDGPGPVRDDAKQQLEGLADGGLSVTVDQDTAAAEREAVHGFREQHPRDGQVAAPYRVVPLTPSKCIIITFLPRTSLSNQSEHFRK